MGAPQCAAWLGPVLRLAQVQTAEHELEPVSAELELAVPQGGAGVPPPTCWLASYLHDPASAWHMQRWSLHIRIIALDDSSIAPRKGVEGYACYHTLLPHMYKRTPCTQPPNPPKAPLHLR